MTAYHTGWAWRERSVPSTAKFILLALADQAPDDGTVEINLDVLRSKTGLGRDAIRYALRYLEEQAYLVRDRLEDADMDAADQFRLNPTPSARRAIDTRRAMPNEVLDAING